MRKLKLLLLGFAVIVVIALLAWPVKNVCPKGPCGTAPDAQGYVHRYYEVQPLGAVAIETITNQHLPLSYSSGQVDDRASR
ncbi:hypothetical protein [Mycobacterium kubicae]|nr:hypothetical protein [Mycobacterium kubicae]MCV7098112.1 hypothetical protein [Mycobacterium kubicae]OBK47452.1 hypothetical protein A5657_24625 [Mycobacterium kubicae]ORW03492.1 hypothetical protein AWC13_01775 [Mycobacterium kubicae]QNI12314.1 hypothetical protein GAN18_14815 [Mycobacterium kubicae]QPI35831.1 hypothetical protein I2456_14610 [Mycobacterium kubicae]